MAQGVSGGLKVRREDRGHALEDLHWQGGGEFEGFGRASRHKRSQGAKVVFADVKHERCRAIDRLGTEDASARSHGFDAVITGPGFAAHGQYAAVGLFETARNPARSTGVHYV